MTTGAFNSPDATIALTDADLADGIPLTAGHGVRPLRWLVNGRVLVPADANDPRGLARWHPEGPGISVITLVDGDGRAATSEIRLVNAR